MPGIPYGGTGNGGGGGGGGGGCGEVDGVAADDGGGCGSLFLGVI